MKKVVNNVICNVCERKVSAWIKDKGKEWCMKCHDEEQDRIKGVNKGV